MKAICVPQTGGDDKKKYFPNDLELSHKILQVHNEIILETFLESFEDLTWNCGQISLQILIKSESNWNSSWIAWSFLEKIFWLLKKWLISFQAFPQKLLFFSNLILCSDCPLPSNYEWRKAMKWKIAFKGNSLSKYLCIFLCFTLPVSRWNQISSCSFFEWWGCLCKELTSLENSTNSKLNKKTNSITFLRKLEDTRWENFSIKSSGEIKRRLINGREFYFFLLKCLLNSRQVFMTKLLIPN